MTRLQFWTFLVAVAVIACLSYAIGSTGNRLTVDGTDLGRWTSFGYTPRERRIDITTREGVVECTFNVVFDDRFEDEN
jgi:hypothetical protein